MSTHCQLLFTTWIDSMCSQNVCAPSRYQGFCSEGDDAVVRSGQRILNQWNIKPKLRQVSMMAGNKVERFANGVRGNQDLARSLRRRAKSSPTIGPEGAARSHVGARNCAMLAFARLSAEAFRSVLVRTQSRSTPRFPACP